MSVPVCECTCMCACVCVPVCACACVRARAWCVCACVCVCVCVCGVVRVLAEWRGVRPRGVCDGGSICLVMVLMGAMCA